MNELLTYSGTRLAAMIRRRELSSAEVVEAHIRHVEAVNPTLNAVVRDRFAEARGEARAADRRLEELRSAANGAGPDLGPFHGVPCSIKECFALTGMPNTSGLVARKGTFATRDAPAVSLLRAAGAIPLGVTNVSELCMWMESNNRVYGRTNNPYDPTRIVGGSSGGEGAIIGAGGAPFGLGSDVGGSIRMPAFFNGVFGHKPTGGLVDNAGQYPVAADGASTYLTTGPLARRAEDLWPLLRILARPSLLKGDPATIDVGQLSVVTIEHNGIMTVSDDLLEAQRRCAEVLRARGAKVRTAKLPSLKDSIEIWSAMLAAAGGPSFSEMLGNGKPIAGGRELARWALRRSPHTLPAIALALIEKIPKLMPAHALRMIEAGAKLRQELLDQIGPHGVLLYPSYTTTAPRHYKPLMPPLAWGYVALLNVMEMPATQVPLGLDREGLPLGVQVVGAHGDDHITIAVANELETILGGWTPPPRLHRS